MTVKQDRLSDIIIQQTMCDELSNLRRINQVLSSLGDDHEKNLNALTELAGEICSADCALYNRLEGEVLHTKGRFQAPLDLPDSDEAEGHLCLDVIRSRERFLHVPHLPRTPYLQSDPNVKPYGLETYTGHAVSVSGRPVGSLCVVFGRHVEASEDLRECLSLIAQAIGREELLHTNKRNLDRMVEREAEERARFLTLLEQLNDAVLVEDAERKIVYANPAFETIFGVRPADVVGADCAIMAENSAPLFKDPKAFLKANEDAIRYEVPVQGEVFALRDGRYLSRNFAPIRGDSGGIGSLWHYRDVTRVESTKALLGAVAQLAAIVLESSLDSRESWTAAMAALGSRIDVDRVYVFQDHPAPGDGVHACSLLAEWVQQGIEAEIDNPNLQNVRYVEDGFERWADFFRRDLPIHGLIRDFPESERGILEAQGIQSIVVVPIRIRPEVWGFVGFDSVRRARHWEREEISLLRSAAALIGSRLEFQQSSNALAESEKKFRALFETSPVGIALSRMSDGVIVEANEALHQLLGFSNKDLRKMSFHDLTPRDWRTADESAFGGRLQKSNSSPIEKEYFRRDGSRISVLVNGMAFSRNGEKDLEWSFVQNNSERKRFQDELKEAKDAADAASRAKSTFLATMSHEIRTPLNAVIGIASLLTETCLRKYQKKYAQTIVRSGETLLEIVDDILDYSKIEAERIELEEIDFDLYDAVTEPFEIFGGAASKKNIELTSYIDPSLPRMVRGDRLRLKQITLNLVSNAVKFTSSGEVVLRVERIRDRADGSDVRFIVSDTGIGMSENVVAKLFSPFVQADSSVSRNYGGSGLGLAICHRLVNLMGGTISVESEVGVGSKFTFELFMARGKEDPTDSEVLPSDSVRGKRVLIVDDHPVSRRYLHDQCLKWDMRPWATGSPQEAFDLLAKRIWDWLLLDFNMPMMNGDELARQIDEFFPDQRVPRVLLGSPNEENREELDRLFDGFVAKPVCASSLLEVIGGVSEKKQECGMAVTRDGSGRRLSVLVAEDDKVSREVVTTMVRSIGEEIDSAKDGKEALEMACSRNYDLVLIDIQMPLMHGLEVVRRIRLWETESKAQRVRMVALTANATSRDRDDCLAAGFDDYVSKPIKLETVQRLVEEARAKGGA